VANNGPNAQQLRDLFGSVKTAAIKRQYDEAAKALGALEHLLDQKTKPPTPELGGMDMGQVQALGIKDIPFVGDAIDKAKKEITGSRKVTVIIKNKSDKVLRFIDKSLYGKGEWKPGPPLEIEAAKDGKPGEATIIIETTWGAYGKWVTDSGGKLVYEVVGDDQRRKVKMEWSRSSVKGKTATLQSIEPPSDRYQILPHGRDSDTFEFYFEGGNEKDAKPSGADASVDCLITIHNDTKYVLKLTEQKSEHGGFKTKPPDTVSPGDSRTFAHVQTPHEKDPKQLGCKGSLTYAVDSPVPAVWHCEWNNPLGETNTVDSKVNPASEGLRTLHQIGQGDENVPVDFTLSSDDSGGGGGGESEYTIGPFKVGIANELESGSLEKTLYNILKQLPKETYDAILQGKLAGGKKIQVHGYTSNTDLERRNLNLSRERAKTVISVFGKLGVPASIFTEPIAHGEYETSNPTDDKRQEKEDPKERKVVLKIHGR
jgi:hypothetical protein